MIHYYQHNIEDISLPEKFTFPFHYTPHPLSVLAAEETMAHISLMNDYAEELSKGKMFGVLVIKDKDGKIGYLSAFSGLVGGKNNIPFFVPPVYDLLNPDGYFKREEKNISDINKKIESIECSDEYTSLTSEYNSKVISGKVFINKLKDEIKQSKAKRDELRLKNDFTEYDNSRLIKESQFQKAELKRAEKRIKDEIEIIDKAISIYKSKINSLKDERKERSAALQQYLFSQFSFLNINCETKDLCQIFSETVHKEPPAGAGECAAPKLLQYAFSHNLKPVAMAEFWWGDSPKGHIRHHGHFYPSCKGKCEPILSHMLKGMDIEENPLKRFNKETKIDIVYEDDYLLVINKPAGMLSVPGKDNIPSAESYIKDMYNDCEGPFIVHRLDMATSGLLLFAKDMDIYKILQKEFTDREVKKKYIAVVDGNITSEKGIINLPLSIDHLNRPRQIVDAENGKIAITRYQVLEHISINNKLMTRLALFPLTGRTHQLRVHCAHHQGLNAPILGDELYGTKADRLYLHAQRLEFRHPVTGNMVIIDKTADF